ncbi:ribosomal protein S18 acetylase RimI-like enzyme [Desulfitispora alkaliphila]|uniref:GNAT family N-acetyltransferase n=1 Tax=Desulfitispora alkaliphila TaxID=622674 RepID=UPI003D26357B
MMINLEEYNPKKHDKHLIAELIYQSDEELNSLVYGEQEEAIKVITALIDMEDNYYTSPYIKCVVYQEKFAGVLVGFLVNEKSQIDKSSGKAFAKAMGTWNFLKRMPLLFRMGKITSGEMDAKGYYIHTICVASQFQGLEIGRKIIEILAIDHEKLYLHVNIKKQGAQKFYKRVGFQPQSKGTINHKGKEIGTYLMEKKSS